MSNFKWKKIILIIDLGFVSFIIIYFLYNLIPLFYLSLGYNVDRAIFNIRNATTFGILFVITLAKLFFGFTYYIINKINVKENLFINVFKYYTFLWMVFSFLILTSSVVLIIKNAFNWNYNLLYTILIIIGTFCWLTILLKNNNINRKIEKLFIFLNLISNYLLIIVGYFISIY